MVSLNILLLAGMTLNLFLQIKNKKEDHRLNKGLQHLQNKISILEDLSDKTDLQIRKSIFSLDQKTNEVKTLLSNAEHTMDELTQNMNKSFEIIQMLNEQQPQEEISKKHKTNLYVQAAQLAHQGLNAESIAELVDLSPAEIQMIVKVNKDNLQFATDKLPSWIQTQTQVNKQLNTINEDELKLFSQSIEAQQNHHSQNLNPTAEQSQKSTQSGPTMKAVEKMQNSNPHQQIKPFEFRRI